MLSQATLASGFYHTGVLTYAAALCKPSLCLAIDRDKAAGSSRHPGSHNDWHEANSLLLACLTLPKFCFGVLFVCNILCAFPSFLVLLVLLGVRPALLCAAVITVPVACNSKSQMLSVVPPKAQSPIPILILITFCLNIMHMSHHDQQPGSFAHL